jgi:hypothetical protein
MLKNPRAEIAMLCWFGGLLFQDARLGQIQPTIVIIIIIVISALPEWQRLFRDIVSLLSRMILIFR